EEHLTPVDTMTDNRTMAEMLRAPIEGSELAKFTHAVNQQTSAVTTAMTAMLKQFQSNPPSAQVKAVEKICVTCGGAHPYYQCLAADGNTFPEYRDNIQENNQNRFGQPQGFNRSPNFNQEQPFQATQSNQNFHLNELEKIKRMNDVSLIAMQNQIDMVKNDLRNEMKTSIQTSLSNQTNEIKNIMASLLQMNTASTSGSRTLPGNIIANPKGELKAITTRSGLVTEGPTIPNPPKSINLEEDECLEETYTDPDHAEYNIKVPPPHPVQKPKPPIQRNFVLHARDFLPPRIPDPGKFLIPCGFSELKCKALADLGSSINLMPLSVWKKLGLPDLIPTQMTLELANRAICTPDEIARDVFVPVGKFTFLADFVVVDYESDPRVPLILGRPFLRTARALIDVHEMFTDEQPLDYSFPPRFDVYPDDFLEIESDANFDDDSFDFEGEKINEAELLIDQLDLPCDILFEYDSFKSQDFSRDDVLFSPDNKDKDFDPPLYELLVFKEVHNSMRLLPFSSENEEKVFKPGIYTSKKFHCCFFFELSHPDTTTTTTTSDETDTKSGRTITLTAEDMQKKKNDVKARTTLLLSLPDEHQLQFIWRNKSDLDTMSLDDLYNHLKVYESEVQKKTEPNSQNMAFISSAKHSSGNKDGNTACVPTASASVATISQDTACAYIASQSSGSQIKFKYINQIDEDDMKEMDIKWNMTLLSMRADKFWKRTGKKISIQGSNVKGFDKSKVECFNCHKMGHFARECRAPKSQDKGRIDNFRQGSKAEEEVPKALMAIYGVEWDWSYMANDGEDRALVADEEAPTELALMANTSAKSKLFDNSLYSKDCKENNDSLNKCIETLKKKLETLKQEKEGVDWKLAGLLTASKDLDNLIESQRSDKNKEGLGYTAVPPPPVQLYLSPKKDLSWTGLLECADDTVTNYSRPSPTVESTSEEAQNRNPSIYENVASPITPKPFIKKRVKKNFTPRPVADRPYIPSQRPVRTNMNDARSNRTFFNKQAHSYANRPVHRKSAVRSPYRAPWVSAVNRNYPPVNRKFSTSSRNFPTANKKFFTASREFPTGSTKSPTADIGMKGKATQVSDGLGPQRKLILFGNVQGSSQNKIDDKGYWDSGCSRHMT
nr:ribonuclease H-like domain-containing protein [Tanacetum cinerariifolium]